MEDNELKDTSSACDNGSKHKTNITLSMTYNIEGL